MTTAAMKCERCPTMIAAEAVVYSSAGSVLCRTCMAGEQLAEAEARGAASRRKVRIAIGVTVALVVIVPSVMFALGLGKIVAYTLIGLGVACAWGAQTARRMFVRGRSDVDPSVANGTIYLIGIGLAMILVGALLSSVMT